MDSIGRQIRISSIDLDLKIHRVKFIFSFVTWRLEEKKEIAKCISIWHILLKAFLQKRELHSLYIVIFIHVFVCIYIYSIIGIQKFATRNLKLCVKVMCLSLLIFQLYDLMRTAIMWSVRSSRELANRDTEYIFKLTDVTQNLLFYWCCVVLCEGGHWGF